MRELRMLGSERGVLSNGCPYRNLSSAVHRPRPQCRLCYARLNFNADYRPTRQLKLFLQINNLLDCQNNTVAQGDCTKLSGKRSEIVRWPTPNQAALNPNNVSR